MPAPNANAVTFVTYPSTRELERVLGSPFIKTLYHGAVGTLLFDYSFSPLDIVPVIEYGVTTYALEPKLATTLWMTLKKLAQIIHCAAWDHNPFASAEPLPLSLPLDKLSSINLPAPLISLILASPERNPLLDAFPSIYDVKHRIALVQHIATYYVRWLAAAVERSIKMGADSCWSWGAYWGLSWEEFLAHYENHTAVVRVPLPTYDPAAVDNSLALILHPTASTVAIRANKVLRGDIPVDHGVLSLPMPYHRFYSAFKSLFL
ncbi:hypothetical protein FPV67DRAFT_1665537 [Lyophyllum atratum]|nr:hypothetical protein FPV67DRAFT_1447051 [Lyophyllum atratum]KAF8074783.1 hypothetical protein FPV67DRAFT_1665537 [Lyophyllum atratum]